jgi:hypothetical protein
MGLCSAALAALTACSGGSSSSTPPPAIAVSVTPSTTSLGPSGTQTFTATLANDNTTDGVTWSLSPATGTLSTNTAAITTYTAPATLAAATTVTLTATSVKDPTKSASAAISLSPAISVSIAPTSVPLTAGGTQSFTATVLNDSTGSGVTWSIGSGAGALSAQTSSGVTYTAPATIASTATVTLTATSVKDPTKSAPATIMLQPASINVSVTSAASVPLGGAQTLTAIVANDSTNAGVTWALTSGPGSISGATKSSVTYNAPVGLPAAGSVTITATSVADASKTKAATFTIPAPTAPASQWVYYDANGNLAYKPLDAQGDHIMDFSTAGYGAGGVAIPSIAAAVTLTPSGADDTSQIQTAINQVAAMTPNAAGFRGAVLLGPGNWSVSRSLTITTSGVVLQGSGSGASAATNTVITMQAAATPYPLVVLGSSSAAPSYGATANITDTYVPAGTNTLTLSSVSGLSVGQSIMVRRPANAGWITFMGMNPTQITPSGQCSSAACSWISPSSTEFKTDRVITAINGNVITLDAPMSDSIDSTYESGATVAAFTFASRIQNMGVENFRVITPVPATNLVPPTASYQLVTSYAVLNGWVRNLSAQDSLQAIVVDQWCKQFSVINVSLTHTVTQTDSAKFEDFYINGATQVLMDGISDTANNMYFFSTSSETQGPLVLRNGTFQGNTSIEPHQRWSTGLLVENTTVSAISGGTAGAINLNDRGTDGTGHGWTMGWAVAWNDAAGSFLIQQPPGSENWCIGCVGTQKTAAPPGLTTVAPQGAIDSAGTQVFPASLYQAQLTQRLGQGVTAQ